MFQLFSEQKSESEQVTVKFLLWSYNLLCLGLIVYLLILMRKKSSAQMQGLIALALVGLFVGYFVLERQAIFSQEKSDIVRGQTGQNTPIDLAVVWPQKDSTFMYGINLAVQEINARGGVALGYVGQPKTHHLIHINYYNEDPIWPVSSAQSRAARNLENAAVIGHEVFDSAISASITYQMANLLYIAPTVSADLAIRQIFNNVFQTIPSNIAFSKKIVGFFQERNYKKIAVLYERSDNGTTIGKFLASSIVEANYKAKKSGSNQVIDVVYQASYGRKNITFTDIAAGLMDADFDAIFIAQTSSQSIDLIDEIRKRNINQPIILSQGVSAQQQQTLIARTYQDIFYTSVVPALTDTKEQQGFRDFWARFEKQYGIIPDYLAIQAYEAVNLLAQAWEVAGTVNTEITSATLRAGYSWPGFVGSYKFAKSGAVLERPIFIKQVKDGKVISPETSPINGKKSN
jgi:ABC-type branched-subunit amino acid transport system substrate-binding protein